MESKSSTYEDYVEVHPIYNILICKKCGYAVRPGNSIHNHFRNIDRVKGHVLKDIRDVFCHLPLSRPEDVQPDDYTEPIEWLELHSGYSCRKCRFLTTGAKGLKVHWRQHHAASHGQQPQYSEVSLQTWLGGSYAKYWVVRTPGMELPKELEGEKLESSFEVAMKAVGSHQSELAKLRNERGIREEGLDRDSAWVKEMGWVSHFGDRDRPFIYRNARWIGALKKEELNGVPDEEKKRLVFLGGSIDREVDRCILRLEFVPKITLQLLKGIDTNGKARAFGVPAVKSSVRLYKGAWQRYLGCCWRAHQLGQEEAEERLGMYFTAEQWSLLSDVARELEFCLDDGFQDSGYMSDESAATGPTSAKMSATDMLDRAVFQFAIASIKTRITGQTYRNSLLSFCAVAGISGTNNNWSWFPPMTYTRILAGLMWVSRVFFLEHIFEKCPLDATPIEDALLDHFVEEHAAWMTVGKYTIFSKIVNWMAYGRGNRNITPGRPTIRWTDDREALVYLGDYIYISDFQQAACQLVADTEVYMEKLCGGFWASQLEPVIDLDRIVDDNPARVYAGWSFAKDHRNRWLQPGAERICSVIESSIWDAKRGCPKKTGIYQWLSRLRSFRKSLVTNIHIWGGQPGRGPEIMTMRHEDSWDLARNVVIYGRAVMIITDRDKMKAVRDLGRKVARFLPPRLGKLVIGYIAWLIPAEGALRQLAGLEPTRQDSHEFMWRDGTSEHWETSLLSGYMADYLHAGVGVKIGVQKYRQIAPEMANAIKGLVIQQVEANAGNEESSDDEDDGAAAGVDGTAGGKTWDIIWDLGSTHGSKIARQHYAVHVGHLPTLTPDMIRNFREISRLWHQFLEKGLEYGRIKRKATRSAGGQVLRKRARIEEKPRDLRREMADGLRELYGPRSTWRSAKQREAMEAILKLEGQSSLVVVLPTGAGKSVLFMVPAVMEGGGINIVVVPFTALADDLVSRARMLGIRCSYYQSSEFYQHEKQPSVGRLIIVSADVASKGGFLSYADGIRARGLLGRIFIDEGHTIITDVNYRRELGELGGLHRLGCPIILLTATLPVSLEVWMREAMMVEDAAILRDETSKLNCQYTVELVERKQGAINARVIQLAREIGKSMISGQKGVIYCVSKEDSRILAEELGCDFYNSDVDVAARKEVLDRWVGQGLEGSRWITATTGLGTGVDIGGITAVIHAGQPYGLIDLVQQTGRGARREGEVVQSTVVHDGRKPWIRSSDDCVAVGNKTEMGLFLSTESCRRTILMGFFDGIHGKTCRDLAGAVECDNCQARMRMKLGVTSSIGEAGAQERRNRWMEMNKRMGRVRRILVWWLEEVEFKCSMCEVKSRLPRLEGGEMGEIREHGRGDERCEEDLWVKPREARKRLRFDEKANGCCFRCKLPADWCVESRIGGQDGQCRYMDKVLPAVLVGLKSKTVREYVAKKMRKYGVDWEDMKQVFEFMQRGVGYQGTRGLGLHYVWEMTIWAVYGEERGRLWVEENYDGEFKP